MRRLRENTMSEAEISPSGTVLVEGHHVGELQGFRFTADQSAGGEAAKAVRAAAQKALAAEFETRAERFAASGNNDIALGDDGVLRWIGAPIATLVAGEDVLRPRLVLLADEQLTGPARDKVVSRAERFVTFHIETLLKPLVDLKANDQLTGIARGIAFQLVENLGLLNRRDIAEDMRSLEQDGRAALRRLGVRFGAYHVFVPALLKPAPARLVTLLWALQNDGKDKPGYGDVVLALATGRTSVVVDQTFDRNFYRLAGYRSLGRRAVRVDILERLADLIRPAINWKPGLGPRPDGAFDGGTFTVTPPMMSILGATAEDMEEILKGLGYRAEPKPADEVKAKVDAYDTAAREAAEAKAAAEAAQAATVEDAPATSEPAAQDGQAIADADAAGPAPSEAPEQAPVETEQDEAAETVAPASEGPQPVTEVAEVPPAAQPEEGAGEPSVEAQPAEPAEEPKPVLIWRQGRFARQHQRSGGRHGQRGQQARSERPEGGEGRKDDNRRFDRNRKGGKPAGDRFERKGDRQDAKGGGKPKFEPRKRDERPARIDPDSPFAKLAALRDQLKK